MGWARIAKFLGCSVATAKRREREGLSIARVGGVVCALPEDVDRWFKDRGRKRRK
jgi:hypothetical protein